jgi:hypothetical protein
MRLWESFCTLRWHEVPAEADCAKRSARGNRTLAKRVFDHKASQALGSAIFYFKSHKTM